MGHFEKEIDATEAAASLDKAISELITDLDGVHDELDEFDVQMRFWISPPRSRLILSF